MMKNVVCLTSPKRDAHLAGDDRDIGHGHVEREDQAAGFIGGALIEPAFDDHEGGCQREPVTTRSMIQLTGSTSRPVRRAMMAIMAEKAEKARTWPMRRTSRWEKMQPSTKPVAQAVPSRPSEVGENPFLRAAHWQQQAMETVSGQQKCRSEQKRQDRKKTAMHGCSDWKLRDMKGLAVRCRRALSRGH
jgi:hypothetical protein